VILRLATNAMGTRFEFVLSGEPDAPLRAVGEAALDEIHRWHDRLSLFQADSELSFINRTAAERPIPVDADLWELLSLCAHVHGASTGAFDPTLAPLMQRHGFHPGDAPPDATVGWADSILLDPVARTIRFTRPAVRLDLGAVAKGFALDRAADIIRAHAVTTALFHAGTSSIIALGAPSTSPAGWAVSVRSDAAPLTLTLRNQALGVSAPRGRTIDVDGHTISHILDPRTAKPVDGVDTAAIIAASAAEADAWSTALVVLGDRPAAMPARLRSFVHTAQGWSPPVAYSVLPEVA